MSKLIPVEYQDQRILTTAQLAESYGTEARRISENFNANKERYMEGKHFFLLQGDELKQFGDHYGNSVSVERVSKLYLWTEKGAWLHAKSLNTDKAWEAYEMLVDEYYRIKELPIQAPATLKLKEEEARIKAINAQARLMNAQVRQSRFILEEADKRKTNLSKVAYELLQINGFEAVVGKNVLPRPKLESDYYDLGTMADKIGLLSGSKLPHAQAIGAILSKLSIDESERLVTAFDRNGHQGSTYQYAPSVLAKVKGWLADNGHPTEIPYMDSKGGAKTYKVVYSLAKVGA